MISQSIRFLFIAAVITSVAAQYVTYRSYTDEQCTTATGGYVVTTGSCDSVTNFKNCSDGGGLYVKAFCSSTDPMSPLPKDVAINIDWARSSTCEPTINEPYLYAYVGTPGSCFMFDTLAIKFDQCQNGNLTMHTYTNGFACKSGSELGSDASGDGVCTQIDTRSQMRYCPIPSPPTAPTSATPSAKTPAKASNAIITASISLTMLIGAVALLA